MSSVRLHLKSPASQAGGLALIRACIYNVEAMKKPTLVILSGGMDSTVLAYHIKSTPSHELKGCVSVNYGQRHAKELECAAKTCSRLQVPHYLVDMRAVQLGLGASALTGGGAVPEGHYAEASMKATVVPNRNMILIALAAGVAITHKCAALAYGAHAGDHAIYPDCRPEFADAVNRALALCDYNPPELIRPFIRDTKAEIVRLGFDLGVHFEETWTCYNGEERPCGRCGTCVERLEAFDIAGEVDPFNYEDHTFWREAVKSVQRQA